MGGFAIREGKMAAILYELNNFLKTLIKLGESRIGIAVLVLATIGGLWFSVREELIDVRENLQAIERNTAHDSDTVSVLAEVRNYLARLCGFKG